ncbi:hypothetical protein LSAC_00466 [Levilinea saccharolytica]|nr:hypothetical protein LSAC_00466 [Levilinea saccharolytica]
MLGRIITIVEVVGFKFNPPYRLMDLTHRD